MDYRWTCQCCGEVFETLPLNYGFEGPDNWHNMPEHERAQRVELTSELCTIDGHEHYVRGCLEVPVHGSSEPMVWGVWVSISEQSRARILELWEAPVVEDEPPRFGWLCTWVNGYPKPHEIRCHIHIRAGGMRPSIRLQPSDYPLALEQAHGITLDHVKEIAARAHL